MYSDLHKLNLMVVLIETTYKNNSGCVNTIHYAWIASFHYQRYFFKINACTNFKITLHKTRYPPLRTTETKNE